LVVDHLLPACFEVLAVRSIFVETLVPDQAGEAVFHYLVEGVRGDGCAVTLIDRRTSDFDGHIRYDAWPGQRVKHVRITITRVPSGSTPGLLDFCVFGRT